MATDPQHPKPTAVKKEPKADKGEKKVKAKKEKDPNAISRPRLPKYPDDHVITVLKPDSKARGAAERFKKYRTGMTVKDYVAALASEHDRTTGQTQADMRWDVDHQFIHVGPSVVDVPPQPSAA